MKIVLCVLMVVCMSCGAFAQVMTDYEAINNLIVAERLYRVSHRNEELAQCYAPEA